MKKILMLSLFVVLSANLLKANDSIRSDENAKIVIFRENIYVGQL